MKSISWYKSLSQPRPRREAGYFLIDGKRSVDHILTRYRRSVHELLCVNDTAQSYQQYQSDIPIREISEANMKSISPSRAPQGIIALVRLPNDVYTAKIPELPINAIRINNNSTDNGNLNNNDFNNTGINATTYINANRDKKILLLEHIQDPGNVGTLIRTAAAFGVAGVIMSDKCADPFSPKAVQSTAGTMLSLWIRKTNGYLQMIYELKNCGYNLIAADTRGADFQSQERGGPSILALGNEGTGLSVDVINMSDYRVRIPISDSGAESLNVAVAGGILMFDCQKFCLTDSLK